MPVPLQQTFAPAFGPDLNLPGLGLNSFVQAAPSNLVVPTPLSSIDNPPTATGMVGPSLDLNVGFMGEDWLLDAPDFITDAAGPSASATIPVSSQDAATGEIADMEVIDAEPVIPEQETAEAASVGYQPILPRPQESTAIPGGENAENTEQKRTKRPWNRSPLNALKSKYCPHCNTTFRTPGALT